MFNYFCIERVFLRQTGEIGHGPSSLAFMASQRLVCRELTERVAIVIVFVIV